jgi:hypothetical protein
MPLSTSRLGGCRTALGGRVGVFTLVCNGYKKLCKLIELIMGHGLAQSG